VSWSNAECLITEINARESSRAKNRTLVDSMLTILREIHAIAICKFAPAPFGVRSE